MYRITDIQKVFGSLVGFREDYGVRIAGSLNETESGLYVQDQHPLLTLRNLKKIAPEKFVITDNVWQSTENYKVGDVVNHHDVQYRALRDNTGSDPEGSADWEVYDGFSSWLADKRQASITKAITRYCTEKKETLNGRTLLENRYLFTMTGRLSDTVEPTGSLCGFEIIPARYRNVTLRIQKIGLQFTGVGDIKLYLYHSSNPQCIREIVCTKTKAGSMEWFPFNDLMLPYVSEDNDSGGSWYLVYDENELPQGCKAIRKDYDWGKGPCTVCSRIDREAYLLWSRYIGINPFKTAPVGDGSLWDIEDNLYTSTTNYGINLQVSAECDITDFLIDNKMDFADVVAKQMALDFLSELYYNANSRINADVQNENMNKLMWDIEGVPDNAKSGLKYELRQAMEAVKVDTSGIDKVCLPCRNKGIRVGSL